MPVDKKYTINDMVLYAENTYTVYKHFQDQTLPEIVDLITTGQWTNRNKRDTVLGEFADFVISRYSEQSFSKPPRFSRAEKAELIQKLYKSFEEMIVDSI